MAPLLFITSSGDPLTFYISPLIALPVRHDLQSLIQRYGGTVALEVVDGLSSIYLINPREFQQRESSSHPDLVYMSFTFVRASIHAGYMLNLTQMRLGGSKPVFMRDYKPIPIFLHDTIDSMMKNELGMKIMAFHDEQVDLHDFVKKMYGGILERHIEYMHWVDHCIENDLFEPSTLHNDLAQEFTIQGGSHLMAYIATSVGSDVLKEPSGPDIYQELVADTAQHPWASTHSWEAWQACYCKQQKKFDASIQIYLDALPHNARPSSSDKHQAPMALKQAHIPGPHIPHPHIPQPQEHSHQSKIPITMATGSQKIIAISHDQMETPSCDLQDLDPETTTTDGSGSQKVLVSDTKITQQLKSPTVQASRPEKVPVSDTDIQNLSSDLQQPKPKAQGSRPPDPKQCLYRILKLRLLIRYSAAKPKRTLQATGPQKALISDSEIETSSDLEQPKPKTILKAIGTRKIIISDSELETSSQVWQPKPKRTIQATGPQKQPEPKSATIHATRSQNALISYTHIKLPSTHIQEQESIHPPSLHVLDSDNDQSDFHPKGPTQKIPSQSTGAISADHLGHNKDKLGKLTMLRQRKHTKISSSQWTQGSQLVKAQALSSDEDEKAVQVPIGPSGSLKSAECPLGEPTFESDEDEPMGDIFESPLLRKHVDTKLFQAKAFLLKAQKVSTGSRTVKM
ncbi:hypothetical protein BS47DRAFT_1366009 [Hydnum rufescens UP504]|uniref:Uncharacterized protein n=1 Tax=Hydnum rufescens UP504 TaxID=1448309 RepID=A0A9P6AN97_9AGAM|nr:hypothetical protein BS47DRAFT_1366009 [Hydnum rufescens UP504]